MNHYYYYEIHITIDPACRYDDFLWDALQYWQLILSDSTNGDDGMPERVLTTRRDSKNDASSAVHSIVSFLNRNGYKVLRYKVELAVVDSKLDDEWKLLT